MRHCRNERPEVFEAENQDLPALLREVATQIESLDGFVSAVQIFPYTTDNGDFTHMAHLFVS